MSKIVNFFFKKIRDGRLIENRILMHIFRKDFVNTLRFDIVDILAAQKIQEETFKKYKNCNYGKEVAIIATGPSLNKYKPLKDVLHLGVNKAVLRDDIYFDYFFMQDYMGVRDYINKLKEDRFKNTKKFLGIMQDYTYNGTASIPESIALELNAERYCIFHQWHSFRHAFQRDISLAPFATADTVAGTAIQFALYTNPKRIYLVGIDCSNTYFDNKKAAANLDYTIETWEKVKEFASIWYPSTEIVSINPVGLKGLFKDIYQE